MRRMHQKHMREKNLESFSDSCEGFSLCSEKYQQEAETNDVVILGEGIEALILGCFILASEKKSVRLYSCPYERQLTSLIVLNSRSLEILERLKLFDYVVREGDILKGLSIRICRGAPFQYFPFENPRSIFPYPIAFQYCRLTNLLRNKFLQLGGQLSSNVKPIRCWVPHHVGHERNTLLKETKHSLSNEFTQDTDTSSTFHSPSYQRKEHKASIKKLQTLLYKNPSHDHYVTEASNLCITEVYDFHTQNFHKAISQYVVACDGAYSTLREALGLSMQCVGPYLVYHILYLVVQYVEGTAPVDRVHALVEKGFLLLLLPFLRRQHPNHWCMIKITLTDSLPHPCREKDNILLNSEIEKFLHQFYETAKLVSILQQHVMRYPNSIAEKFQFFNAFLIGDAAHIHPSFLFSSVNTGIQDAFNLAWRLNTVLCGGSHRCLEGFHFEQHEAAVYHTQQTFDLIAFFSKARSATWCFPSCSSFYAHKLRAILLYDAQNQPFGRYITLFPAHNYIKHSEANVGTLLYASSTFIPIFLQRKNLYLGVPTSLFRIIKGYPCVYLIAIHVLPIVSQNKKEKPSHKNEYSVRWNLSCLLHLMCLVRVFSSMLSSIKIVWVLCGLINLKSSANDLVLNELHHHIPDDLIQSVISTRKYAKNQTILLDYENELFTKFKLYLSKPYERDGDRRSGAFILLRPDSYISCNGYAADAQAIQAAIEHISIWCNR